MKERTNQLDISPLNATASKEKRLTVNRQAEGSSPIPPLLENELLDMPVGQFLASLRFE